MIIIRQKEYTSLPRKIGAKLKRARVDFANSMGRKLQKENVKDQQLQREANKIRVNDSKLLKESIREAKNKYDARTLNGSNYELGSQSIRSNEIIKAAEKSNLNLDEICKPKLANAVKKNKNIIFLSGSDVADHSHEVGHLKNDSNGGLNNRIYHRFQDSGGSDKIKNSIKTSNLIPILEKSGKRKKVLNKSKNIDIGSGLKEYFKRAVEGRAVVNEERKASKNAIRFLKQHGATKSILDSSKSKLDKALDSYKTEAKIYRRMPLQNSLQIESRRRK